MSGDEFWKDRIQPLPASHGAPKPFPSAPWGDQLDTMSADAPEDHVFDVLVVGAGAAGVGVAVALKDAGVKDFMLLERHVVGASFALWPSETRFITPSFPTNSVGMLDLNSVALGTSPAFMLGVEHPTGLDFAAHLVAVAQHYALPVLQHADVQRVVTADEGFHVELAEVTLRARHVVWAAGEFQYPRLHGFTGSERCRHTATIPSYADLEGEEFIVVGGYESGIDAAYHLANRNKRVQLFDRGCPWQGTSSDPSISLSVYSLERMREERFVENVELIANTAIEAVTRNHDMYEVLATDGQQVETDTQPLLAGGLIGGTNAGSDRDGALTGLDADPVVIDLHQLNSTTLEEEIWAFEDIPAQRFDDVGYALVPLQDDARVVGNVEPDVVDVMVAAGASMYFAGYGDLDGDPATEDDHYRFEWLIEGSVVNTRCLNGTDESYGVVVEENQVTEAEMTFHLDHLLWDNHDAEEPHLVFEAYAAASALAAEARGEEDDHLITIEDLESQELSDLRGLDGGELTLNGERVVFRARAGAELENDTLRDYLIDAALSTGHFNGEGHCEYAVKF